MQYIAKLWLNDKQYLAVLEKALVIVTVDSNKKPVRWAIFQESGQMDKKEFSKPSEVLLK